MQRSIVAIEDGLAALTQVMTEHAEETNKIGQFTNEVSPRLGGLVQRGAAREARVLVIGIAQKLAVYADKVADQNERYSTILGELRTALEYILRAQRPRSAGEVAQLRSFLATLATVEQNSTVGRSATSRLADTLRNTPSVERSFNRACGRTVRELERFAENIEQTAATIARAREIGESKLPTSDAT